MRPALISLLLVLAAACGDSSDSPTPGDGDGAPEDGQSEDGSPADGKPADGADDGGAGDGDGAPADGDAGTDEPTAEREEPFVKRPVPFTGPAISYSPYRDGQSPDRETPDGSGMPTDAQILEDLQIISQQWKHFRTYSSGKVNEAVVRVLDESGIDMTVQLGAWLEPEPDQAARDRNEAEVANLLKIAAEHPKQVVALTVANEVLVDWSTHKVAQDRVIYFVRKVRAASKLPVSVADNYVWWRTSGLRLAQEVDYLVIHTYPFWEKYDIDLTMGAADRRAIEYTIANYEGVKARHPDMPIVIGEAGWASLNNWNAQITPGAGSEEKQKIYIEQLNEWTQSAGITTFIFEAFDENWKGSTNPLETEKHWGLFKADRTPKLVMKELYPDLLPSEL